MNSSSRRGAAISFERVVKSIAAIGVMLLLLLALFQARRRTHDATDHVARVDGFSSMARFQSELHDLASASQPFADALSDGSVRMILCVLRADLADRRAV